MHTRGAAAGIRRVRIQSAAGQAARALAGLGRRSPAGAERFGRGIRQRRPCR
nr:MAG TPA: hypothetical protein [Caudoviricetes sp.]